MEYYSARLGMIYKHIHATTWMNFKNIHASERSQTQKATFSSLLYSIYRVHLYSILKNKAIMTEIRSIIAGVYGWGINCKGTRRNFFGGDGNSFYLDCSGDNTTI